MQKMVFGSSPKKFSHDVLVHEAFDHEAWSNLEIVPVVVH